MRRTREFFFLLPVSVFIWLIFECINFSLKNWYYVNVIEITPVRWIGYIISFATVLPALFETTELIESTALLRAWRVRPRQFTPKQFTLSIFIGIMCLLLCISMPRYFFALVWCGFILVLEPLNYLWGAPSLLRGWQHGSLRKPVLLMLSGLLCGIFWELWNFWATTKWIYTVPFFDSFKLFEMTAPGFLGFIPFALECYAMTAFIYLLRNKYGWESDTWAVKRASLCSRPVRILLVLGGVCFCCAVFKGIDLITVDSGRSYVKDMPIIPHTYRERLERCGVIMARDLLRLKDDTHGQQRTRACVAATPVELAYWIKAAEMVMLKGMGTRNFQILSRAGITDVETLAQQDAPVLRMNLEKLCRNDNQKDRIPDEAKIRVWITAARRIKTAS